MLVQTALSKYVPKTFLLTQNTFKRLCFASSLTAVPRFFYFLEIDSLCSFSLMIPVRNISILATLVTYKYS